MRHLGPKLVCSRCGLRFIRRSPAGVTRTLTRTRHDTFGLARDLQVGFVGFDLRNVAEHLLPPGVYGLRAARALALAAPVAPGAILEVANGAERPARLRVLAAAGERVAKLEVIDPGLFLQPSPDPIFCRNGSVLDPEWESAAYAARIAIDPDWDRQDLVGLKATRHAAMGVLPSGERARDILVRPGRLTVTDPIPFRASTAPQAIGLRQLLHGPGLPQGRPTVAWAETFLAGSDGLPDPDTRLRPTAPGRFQEPAAIVGIPSEPMIAGALIADSIGSALEDEGDETGHNGWFERMMRARGYAALNLSRAGDRISSWVQAGGSDGRIELLRLCRLDFAIVSITINNIAKYMTWPKLQRYEANLVERMREIGIRFVGTTTTTPIAEGDPASVEGQRPSPGRNETIQERNAALRSGRHEAGFDGVIDWGDVVEAEIGSGTWPAGASHDLTHPVAATFIRMAAAAERQVAGWDLRPSL